MTVSSAPAVIHRLSSWGVNFDQEGNEFHLTREGGHSARRIIHAADATGHAISDTLLQKAEERKNLTLLHDYIAVDLITRDKLGLEHHACIGGYFLNKKTGEVDAVTAKATALATGGASKVYLYTTNPDIATGDGVAMAYRAGASVANMEFVQFHPTCQFLYLLPSNAA